MHGEFVDARVTPSVLHPFCRSGSSCDAVVWWLQVVPALDIMRNLFAHSDAKFLAKQTGEEDSASSTHPGTQPVTSSSPQQANGKQEDPATAASRMLLESTWQAQQKQQDGSNGPQATPPSSPAMSEQSSTCGSAASGTSGAAQTKQGAGMGSSRSSSSSESGQGGGRGMKVAWEEYAASAGISTQDTGMGNTLDAALAAARAALARQKVTGAFFAGSGSGAWGQSGQQGSGNVSSSGAGSGLRFTGMGMPSMHSRAASASGRGRKGGRGAGRRGYVVQEGSHGARLLMGRPLELAPVPPDMPPAEVRGAWGMLLCDACAKVLPYCCAQRSVILVISTSTNQFCVMLEVACIALSAQEELLSSSRCTTHSSVACLALDRA